MDAVFPKNGRIMRCAWDLCLTPGHTDLIWLIVRPRGRGCIDRFSGRLPGLRSDREACSPLRDRLDRDSHFLVWAWSTLSA